MSEERIEAGHVLLTRGRSDDGELRLGQRPGRLRLEIGEDRALEFDLEGRVLRREAQAESWRLTLDGRVLRWQGPRDRRRRLSPLPEADEILAGEVALLENLDSSALDENSRQWIHRALRFDAAGRRRDRARLEEIYQPIPVLPPDQYDSLVLQVTEGCPYDRCRFCNFYRGVRHRIRKDREFEAHFDAVLEHLGASVQRSRRVFLGQANALLAGGAVLERRLELVRQRLGIVPTDLPPRERPGWRRDHPLAVDGCYSFVDAFHQPPGVDELRSLGRRGLRRVYLGVESGSEAVLELLGKPSSNAQVIELAERLHRAGIALGVIVLVGAGGRRWRDEHERQTTDLFGRLGLVDGDQIYLSRLVVHEGGEYSERARAEGIEALDSEELNTSFETLRRAARPRAIVADYDLEQISQWSPRP